MKRPLIRGKDFHNFHWTRKTSSKRGHGKLGRFLFFFVSCVFFLGKGGE
jgi:hypothetical protein